MVIHSFTRREIISFSSRFTVRPAIKSLNLADILAAWLRSIWLLSSNPSAHSWLKKKTTVFTSRQSSQWQLRLVCSLCWSPLQSFNEISNQTAVKFVLFLYCLALRSKSSQVQVLWEDHRNDLFINGFGKTTQLQAIRYPEAIILPRYSDVCWRK